MATPQQQDSQPKPQQPPRRNAPRITDVVFREAAGFNSGANTAAIGERNVVSIIPGSVDSTGRAAAALDDGDRPSDGLVVTLKQRNPDGKTTLETWLVPWSNVRDVKFETVVHEAPAPAPAA